MSDLAKIQQGTKLHMAFDVPMGSAPDFNMMCSYAKAMDDVSFLISIPMLGGKSLVLDENQKFLIRYSHGNEVLIMAAYPDGVVKEGIRRLWRMRRVTEARQFFQRRDERIKITLRVNYLQPTWPMNEDGKIDPRQAMTLDISAGGVALYINTRYDVGEMIEIDLPRIGIDPEGAGINGLISVACWTREAPKGSLYRYISGYQFHMSDMEREQVSNYVSYAKKKYKL